MYEFHKTQHVLLFFLHADARAYSTPGSHVRIRNAPSQLQNSRHHRYIRIIIEHHRKPSRATMCVSIYKYSQLNTNESISDSEKPQVLTEEETEKCPWNWPLISTSISLITFWTQERWPISEKSWQTWLSCFQKRAYPTELNNVLACANFGAKIDRWSRNPILSNVRDDFLFCSFDVLFCLMSAKIWTLKLNGFILIFKFTYRNNKKYSTWHVNWRGRSCLWLFAKLEYGMFGITRGE